MKPAGLATRIFLDGGDEHETAQVRERLGFLDGQTTNPSLVAKNPEAQAHLKDGGFEPDKLLEFYRGVITKASEMLPNGSVSIEVYADPSTTAEQMLEQGREMNSWIPNAHIKFPTTEAGLAAAEQAIADGMRVNMTLCFTQQQAAAVYAATKGATKGQVFVSPFVGRLDDRGENGIESVSNIIKMYQQGDGHVEVLAASIRTIDHLLASFSIRADIATVPAKVLNQWADQGTPVPDRYDYDSGILGAMPFEDVSLDKPWREYDLRHPLTDQGIEKFDTDWNSLLKT